MKQLVLLCGIILSSVSAWSSTEIKDIVAKVNDEAFSAVYSVSDPVEQKQLKINYRPRSIELEFKDAVFPESKSIVRVDHPLVDRVYTATKNGKSFSRIILKEGEVAENFKDNLSLDIKDNKIHLSLFSKKKIAAVGEDLDSVLEKEVAKILSQEMPEKVEATTATVSTGKSAQTDAELKESEIPVLTKEVEKKVEAKSPYFRMIMSFTVIALFAVAMAMVTRWWKKRGTKSEDNNKIRLVTQHFLGPRKSLAIVRVAGENILIGVTDSNINMIKSLSLLDEDSMDSIDPTKSFGEVLQSQGHVADANTAVVEEDTGEEDFSFKQIKDRISNRVKDMRPL